MESQNSGKHGGQTNSSQSERHTEVRRERDRVSLAYNLDQLAPVALWPLLRFQLLLKGALSSGTSCSNTRVDKKLDIQI